MVAWRPKLIAQVAVPIAFSLYSIVFASAGVASLISDASVKQDPCGHRTHIWKYAMFNTVFSILVLATYGTFPGGGEGARARALLITILHFGFCMWAILTITVVPECIEVLQEKFVHIFHFHHLCMWHNAVFLVLYMVHEVYLGEKVGGDLTLMPEVMKVHTPTYDYQYNTGVVAAGTGVTGQQSQPPPELAATSSPVLPEHKSLASSAFGYGGSNGPTPPPLYPSLTPAQQDANNLVAEHLDDPQDVLSPHRNL